MIKYDVYQCIGTVSDVEQIKQGCSLGALDNKLVLIKSCDACESAKKILDKNQTSISKEKDKWTVSETWIEENEYDENAGRIVKCINVINNSDFQFMTFQRK